MPEFMLALILVLILAASMSTLASLILVSSSAIAVDLTKAVKPDADKKKQVLLDAYFLCSIYCYFFLYCCRSA